MVNSGFRLLFVAATLVAASSWAFEPPLDATYRTINLPACDSGASNVKIMTSASDMNALNDSQFDVFCFDAGDYRASGRKTITVSGTSNVPKVIRARSSETAAWNLASHQRVELPSIVFRGASNWVVQGVAFSDGPGDHLLNVREDSDNVIVSDVLIEDCNASCLYWGSGSDDGLFQRSVVRRTGITGQERHNIFVSVGNATNPSEHRGIAGLAIIGNELSDAAGDNIQVWTSSTDISDGDVRGLQIQGNDLYMSQAMYVNSSGSPDPNGSWSCSENAIDVKVAVSGDSVSSSVIMSIDDNRIWGHRKTSTGSNRVCTGSSSHAYAILMHRQESDYVSIERNIILDTENGVLVQGQADNATIRNNLFGNVSNGVSPRGVFELTSNGQVVVTDNYVVDSQRYLKAGGDDAMFRDNTVVNGGGWAITNGQDFSSNSYVGNNRYLGNSYAYDGAADHGDNETNASAPNGQYCFTRKRLSGPESVCIADFDESEIGSTSDTSVPLAPSGFAAMSGT